MASRSRESLSSDIESRVIRTDNPGELITIRRFTSLDAELWEVVDSPRCWSEYNTVWTVCVPTPGGARPGCWVHRGRVNQIAPDTIMLLQPGEPHQTRSVDGAASFLLCRFGNLIAEEVATKLELPRSLSWKAEHLRSGKGYDDVRNSLFLLQSAMVSNPDTAELTEWWEECVGLLLSRCTDVNPRRSVSLIPHHGARRAWEYLRHHHQLLFRRCFEAAQKGGKNGVVLPMDITHDLDLETLAREAGLRPSRFWHLIKERLLITPKDYQRIARVTVGRILLEAGVPSFKIALLLGYGHQSYFTRVFRQTFGVAPSHWPHWTQPMHPVQGC